MKKRKGLWDIALIGGCLLAACVLFLLSSLGRAPGAEVIVRVEGEEVARYSLAASGTYVLNGGTNVLTVEEGSARLTEADCPDHLCVRQGRIGSEGQVITCLPNKLTVTVAGGQPSDVDLIS